MSVHSDPNAGQRFGKVVVTVDTEAGDCVVTAPVNNRGPFALPKRFRLNTLDEIRGAYAVHLARSSIDPVSRDIARALEFAGRSIRAAEEAR